MVGRRVAYSSCVARRTDTFSWRQKRGEITMFIEAIDQAHANHKRTSGHHLLSLLIALVFAVTIYPSKAHAQIIGDLQVNIPFQFHVGNTKLPAGQYVIHMLDGSDLRVMEISSADGSTSALFEVQDAEANSTPAKSELIFNKYGNRYFLRRCLTKATQAAVRCSCRAMKRRSVKRLRKPSPRAGTPPGQQGN